MRIWIAIIALAIVVESPAIGTAQSTSAQFSISISTPQAAAKVGSEVKVSIIVTNITDHEISVPMEGRRGESSTSQSTGGIATELCRPKQNTIGRLKENRIHNVRCWS